MTTRIGPPPTVGTASSLRCSRCPSEFNRTRAIIADTCRGNARDAGLVLRLGSDLRGVGSAPSFTFVASRLSFLWFVCSGSNSGTNSRSAALMAIIPFFSLGARRRCSQIKKSTQTKSKSPSALKHERARCTVRKQNNVIRITKRSSIDWSSLPLHRVRVARTLSPNLDRAVRLKVPNLLYTAETARQRTNL